MSRARIQDLPHQPTGLPLDLPFLELSTIMMHDVALYNAERKRGTRKRIEQTSRLGDWKRPTIVVLLSRACQLLNECCEAPRLPNFDEVRGSKHGHERVHCCK